jgi:hypothetical protein
MKRSLILVLILLLVILNACGSNQVSAITVHQADTAAALATLTATNQPPLPSTHTPDTLKIVNWLNEPPPRDQFTINIEQLEDMVGARYSFLTVEFLPENKVVTEFRVDVRCECGSSNGRCCTSEGMFVLTMIRMKQHREEIIIEVPSTVETMRVAPYDQTKPLYGFSADWGYVKSFLREQMTGNQFGFRVTPGSIP